MRSPGACSLPGSRPASVSLTETAFVPPALPVLLYAPYAIVGPYWKLYAVESLSGFTVAFRTAPEFVTAVAACVTTAGVLAAHAVATSTIETASDSRTIFLISSLSPSSRDTLILWV